MDDTRFALLALLGLIGCGRDDPAPKPGGTAPATDPEPFARVFVDVTAEVGIAFMHATGATGEKLYPECLGAGAAWFDREADGDPDLFLVNGRSWDGARSGETSALFVNTEGRYERAGPEVGADLVRYGMGASAADIDGDGDTDLYVTAVEENALLVNEGPRFRELAVERGVADWLALAKIVRAGGPAARGRLVDGRFPQSSRSQRFADAETSRAASAPEHRAHHALSGAASSFRLCRLAMPLASAQAVRVC